MTDNEATMSDELKAAHEAVEKYKALVLQEMADKGNSGHLWTNGQCKDWQMYVSAVATQAACRKKWGV